MAIQLDYVIATGAFLIIFAFAVQYSIGYFDDVRELSVMAATRSDALELLGAAEREGGGWPGSNVSRLGLVGTSYRFTVIVNNTQPFYRNQSQGVQALTELVQLNFSALPADMGSVTIFNESGDIVPRTIAGRNVTFATSIAAGSVQAFVVYFGPGPFAEDSQPVAGTDALNETLLYTEPLSVVHYWNMFDLDQSDYEATRSMLGIRSSFDIALRDSETNATALSFGGSVPTRGNVIALQRGVMYQNATASVRSGVLTVRVWP